MSLIKASRGFPPRQSFKIYNVTTPLDLVLAKERLAFLYDYRRLQSRRTALSITSRAAIRRQEVVHVTSRREVTWLADWLALGACKPGLGRSRVSCRGCLFCIAPQTGVGTGWPIDLSRSHESRIMCQMLIKTPVASGSTITTATATTTTDTTFTADYIGSQFVGCPQSTAICKRLPLSCRFDWHTWLGSSAAAAANRADLSSSENKTRIREREADSKRTTKWIGINRNESRRIGAGTSALRCRASNESMPANAPDS